MVGGRGRRPRGPSRSGGGPSASTRPALDLDALPPEVLIIVFSALPAFEHAARLATVSKKFRDAAAAARAVFLPRVGEDGSVLEPVSGRGFIKLEAGENVRRAIDRCPEGGAVVAEDNILRDNRKGNSLRLPAAGEPSS